MEFEFILDNSWSFFAFLIFKLIECTVGNKHFCALVQIFQLIKKKKTTFDLQNHPVIQVLFDHLVS